MSLRPKDALALLLLCAGMRLPWLWLGQGAAFDLQSYATVAGLPFQELYSSAETLGRYPYLPLWALVLKGMQRLQELLGGAPELWFRLPGVAGDCAIALLLPALALRQGVDQGQARALGLVWCLHPLAWLISGAHGQFDSLPLALLLAALGWHLYGQRASKHRWSALCLGLAVALKSWPLGFLPLFVLATPAVKRVRFAAWAFLPGLLLLLPWILGEAFKDWAPRLAYSGVAALGFPGALRAAAFSLGAERETYRALDQLWRGAAIVLLLLLQCAVAWRASDLRRGLAAAALGLLLLAPGLSPQSLLWALPFCLLTGQAQGLGLASAALAALFYGLFMPQVLAGPRAQGPGLTPGLHLAWSALNLGWWAYALWHFRRAWRALR